MALVIITFMSFDSVFSTFDSKTSLSYLHCTDLFSPWEPLDISHWLTPLLKSLASTFPGASAVKNPPTMEEMQEMWLWSLGRKDLLEEEMAAHSSILAWEIPWTEEPGRFLCPWGCKRAGHDWACTHRHTQASTLPFLSCLFRVGHRGFRHKEECLVQSHILRKWSYVCWRGRDGEGVWEGHVHTAIFKMDNQQGPIV